MARVLLAMSGGVDSSVAALLLRREGHEVIGLFMRHGHVAEAEAHCAVDLPAAGKGRASGISGHEPGRAQGSPGGSLSVVSRQPVRKQGCCSAADAQDARRVADRLAIPFYALDFQDQFGRIMDYFVHEYSAGRTPNPCVMCNNWLKFGALADYADGVGAEFIATGHYATLRPTQTGTPALCRGLDPAKDQSYVLFGIDRRLLPRLLFPIGSRHKRDVRQLAREAGLRVADKHDSQEICFVADGDHARFVRQRSGLDLSGEIVTTAGEVVGRHEGLENFTVGQRKGLGVALGRAQFVVRIEPETRRVVIGDRPDLARTTIHARRTNWLIDESTGDLRCQVKIRYQSRPVAATALPLSEGRLRAELDEPQYGVAPGQALVVYDSDRVLGGGWIE